MSTETQSGLNDTWPLPGNEIRGAFPVSPDSPAHVTSWLTIITIIAAAFRFAALGSKSLWLDEVFSLDIARSNFSSVWHDLSSPQVNDSVFALYMSLYYTLLHFWVRLGASEIWLRLPSALCGLATVPLLYALGSRLFTKRAGLAAAFLLAVQPVHVAYSQEARSYSLCVFLSVTAFYFFIRAVQEGAGKWWLLYVISTVLAIYSHLFAVFLLPAQWLSLLFLNRKKAQLKPAILSTTAILLLIFPVFSLAIVKDFGKFPWAVKPGMRELFHAVQTLTGAGLKLPVYLLVLGMAGISFRQAWRNAGESPLRWRHALLWGWFLLPVASIVLASLWKPPLFPRYLIVSLPASTLLAAVGLCRLRSNMKFTAATVALGALFIPAIFTYYATPKEDWRGATAYLLTHARPEDGIVFYREWGQQPFDYYHERMGSASVGPSILNPFRVLSDEAAAAHRMPTIWLVLYGLHPRDRIETALLEKAKTSLENGHVLVGQQPFHEIEILCYSSKTAQLNEPSPGSPATQSTLVFQRRAAAHLRARHTL